MFTISSSSLQDGQTVPKHFVLDGDNYSPAIEWQGAPPETKSYAITVFDPDAPTDHGWWHWTVVNIPSDITSLPEGASNQRTLPPEAIEVMSDFNRKTYGGPHPPKGDKPHRYVFTVYALKDKLLVSPGADGISMEKNIEASSLAKASFTVKYGR